MQLVRPESNLPLMKKGEASRVDGRPAVLQRMRISGHCRILALFSLRLAAVASYSRLLCAGCICRCRGAYAILYFAGERSSQRLEQQARTSAP